MRAMCVVADGGDPRLVAREVPEPTIADDQVAIHMEATAVSFGDVEMRRGRYHTPRESAIPGHDVVGTVMRVGSKVGNLRLGERVTAISLTGSYAEIVVAPAAVTWRLPEDVDLLSAAAFPTNGVTAFNVLTLAGRLAPGESVLIHAAAGGVGTTSVQLAKLLGARLVIGTVGDSAKAKFVKDLGCDHVINYREEDFAARARELTNGSGANVILDSVAGPTTEQSLNCLAPWGRIVVFGMSAGTPGRIATNVLHVGNRSAIGYSTGAYRYADAKALRAAGETVLEHLSSGRLRLIVGAQFKLEEANAALDLVESRRTTGRVVLTMD